MLILSALSFVIHICVDVPDHCSSTIDGIDRPLMLNTHLFQSFVVTIHHHNMMVLFVTNASSLPMMVALTSCKIAAVKPNDIQS